MPALSGRCIAFVVYPDSTAGVTDTVSLASGQIGYQEEGMMKFAKAVGAALAMSALLAALAGCQEQEGPVEQAGKEVDKAAEAVGEKVEQAGESLQDAAQGDKK